ncbi:NnrS family protein [Corynebacterium tuberculostearicum]|uniref:NnrS family protein n=1 Tax=Corynebacterium tuberculostearicum TaxID=38304 RepID=UPI0020267840|nr:NnrS family protein [Corynebacterium tuberculostearicum]
MQNNSVAHRLIFLAFAGLSLLVGLAAGATLLGLTATPGASFAADHGPLMVFGFVGGAIGLERTVAVCTSWAWAGPVCHVAGVLGILAGLPRAVPAVCFAASFLVLGFIYATIYIYRRQASLAILVQAAGVIGGVAAAALWAMGPGFGAAMPLCVLYAVATIIGERMELARVTMAGTRAENHLTLLVLGLAAASVIYVLAPAVGYRAMGLVLIAIAAATARVDVAKNLVRSHSLPRYSAACMLAGYAWLALGGYLWLLHGQSTGFAYDASVHAIFLGFVMSMIFAHAPIIFTSVIRRRLPYHPVLYVPVAFLHGGLALRILADCAEHTTALRTGGVVTIIAVLVFLVCGIVLTGKESRRAHS